MMYIINNKFGIFRRAWCAPMYYILLCSDVDSDDASRCRPPCRFIRWKTERWRTERSWRICAYANAARKKKNTWNTYGLRFFSSFFLPLSIFVCQIMEWKQRRKKKQLKMTSVTTVKTCLGNNVACARFTIIRLRFFFFPFFVFHIFPSPFENVNCLLFHLIYFFSVFCSSFT